MDLKKPTAKRSRRLLWICFVFIAVIVILAIVIPVVILRRNSANLTASILLSLYIYPTNDTSWLPLYDTVEAHPKLKFVVIVNPKSGPGDSPYPDNNYDRAVRRLNSHQNVQTVGYVRTGYATRNISTVISEVNTYARWASRSPELAMRGIFFDESPHEYEAEAVQFMKTVSHYVKNNTAGLQGPKTVIRNPGVIPDSRYQDDNTDVTVIFEEAYPIFETRLATIQAQPKARSKYAFFINSVPTQSKDNLRKFVKNLSQIAEYLYITEESVDFYESFGSMWSDFTAVMPT